MIQPKSRTIDDIFSDGQNRLLIPNYQRNFDWGKDEVEELLSDLQNSTKSEAPRLFLGTFVFDNSREGELEVVDGQQRLTTVALILLACRAVAKKNKLHDLAQELQKKITFTDSATGKRIAERLTVSPVIADVFQYMCDNDWKGDFPAKIGSRPTKRQSNKIRPIYEYIYKEIETLKPENLSEFLRALYRSYVIEIDISDKLEAFDIFERTNARGLDLNVADLLKNYLFANINDKSIEEKWSEIVENSDNSLQRMLKYFWVARNGYIQKKNLYRSLKKYGEEVGPEKLTDSLYQFTRYYSAIRSLEQNKVKEWLAEFELTALSSNEGYVGAINRVFEALKLFQVTQAYPLIYSLFTAYRNSDKGPKETKTLLDALAMIEKYHFVNNVICERVGNEIEKLYAESAAELSQTDDFRTSTTKLVKELKGKKADATEFEPRFADINYKANDIPLIHYVFDRINNYDHHDGQWVPLYNPDKSLLKRNYNIEHFLPQNPGEEVNEEDTSVVDNIGNLLVLSRHSNSSFGNLPPVEKIALLKEPKHSGKLAYLKDFISEYGTTKIWNKEVIQDRAKDLASLGYKKVWNF
jgi:uncharacterized protein with ParB-like and HNH nuclease domain